uniref:EF-hand domain-containing protein n=1 Tax=Cryptomonas curvata TaxID=233186 RepID=A0A7S0M3S9_9CRYP|mmetsp:Transcript_23227/g.48636  ORF Transcript_23227/g.48636 Transcript_23227/m.48636 type:complete len:158 (+) Transcript_23227:13-486(+)
MADEDPNSELKKKIKEAFQVVDREKKGVCDVLEVGTIIRTLNIYPTEKQLQRWIHEIEEEEPTGFIMYEKFEALAVRLSTLEAMNFKRNSEDEILRAFQALDVDKKGYLEEAELRSFMTTYGEKFSSDEVKDMMATALDVELGRVYYEDYAEILAAE